MIPASQIIASVRTRYQIVSSVRWDDGDILDAINEGLDDLSEVTRFYERHVSVPLGNRRSYYDLRGWLPETALGVTSVWGSSITDWLVPISARDLQTRWEQAAGSPTHFFMRGLFWMVVWPRPDSVDVSEFLRVYFAGYAPHFTHPQAVLRDLQDDWVPALEDYALYELSAQDGETSRALMHWQEYTARSTQFAHDVNRRTVTARVLRMGSR